MLSFAEEKANSLSVNSVCQLQQMQSSALLCVSSGASESSQRAEPTTCLCGGWWIFCQDMANLLLKMLCKALKASITTK